MQLWKGNNAFTVSKVVWIMALCLRTRHLFTFKMSMYHYLTQENEPSSPFVSLRHLNNVSALSKQETIISMYITNGT